MCPSFASKAAFKTSGLTTKIVRSLMHPPLRRFFFAEMKSYCLDFEEGEIISCASTEASCLPRDTSMPVKCAHGLSSRQGLRLLPPCTDLTAAAAISADLCSC